MIQARPRGRGGCGDLGSLGRFEPGSQELFRGGAESAAYRLIAPLKIHQDFVIYNFPIFPKKFVEEYRLY